MAQGIVRQRFRLKWKLALKKWLVSFARSETGALVKVRSGFVGIPLFAKGAKGRAPACGSYGKTDEGWAIRQGLLRVV
jgi:hypothetical protein